MGTVTDLRTGSIADVDGVLVGHYQRSGRGWLTGTTAVLTPAGAVAGVDVRGGAPGTRETDLLRPENLVQQIHGLCLTGSSAFGLAAADGVMSWLAEHSIGFQIGEQPDQVVPIVPGAVIFDLGRGGRWDHRATAEFGYLAAQRARRTQVGEGTSGAGTGARSGGLKGGQGTCSQRLSDGTMVGALAVVNSIGSVIDTGSGLPHTSVPGLGLRRPGASERAALRAILQAPSLPLNTTIGVVATDAALTPAEATKLAQVAHDGLARAVRPAHLMNDGDAIFAISTGAWSNCALSSPQAAPGSAVGFQSAAHSHAWLKQGSAERMRWFNQLLIAAADSFAIAVTRGVVLATGTPTFPAYRDLCPSAFR
jgi:L-aminopeptidase/D-esterase-like protein